MKCGRCGERGHSGRHCATNPDSTVRVEMPAHAVAVVWATRLSGIWRAASFSDNPVKTAMISAYVQGAMDGRRGEVDAAMHEQTAAGDARGA